MLYSRIIFSNPDSCRSRIAREGSDSGPLNVDILHRQVFVFSLPLFTSSCSTFPDLGRHAELAPLGARRFEARREDESSPEPCLAPSQWLVLDDINALSTSV